MAYTLTFGISLGAGQAGLVASPGLEALLKTTTGSTQGSAVITGFVDLGGGNYTWTGSIPDGFRGSVSFRAVGNSTPLAISAINPEEAELIDNISVALSASGSVLVNHDYGGTDELAYKTGEGAGIDNADILIYLTTDFNAGNVAPEFKRGASMTDVNGRWVTPAYLDPEDYTIVFVKQGYYGPDNTEITVA